jgi:replicative DNA helicase
MAEPRLQSQEAEKAVLGAVLSDPLVLETVRPVLNAEDFADPKHVHVYAAMCALAQARTPIDHLTVAEALKARGVLGSVGGPAYLMQLDASVPYATRAPDYARTVREFALRRGAVRVAQENAQKASDLGLPVDAVLTEGAREWAKLTHTVKGVRKGPELFLALLDQLDAAQRGEVTLCIKTGIDRWDEVFGGLQPSKLTFLGSQPGVGKSSVFATMVENLCCREGARGLLQPRGHRATGSAKRSSPSARASPSSSSPTGS